MSSRIVAAEHTGGTDRHAWVRSRFAALASQLRAEYADRADPIAAAVLAHWVRETGWGNSEWCFNVGNIKDTAAWPGDGQVLPDGLRYRAYANLSDGIANTLALLRNARYGAAWSGLATSLDGHVWYDALMRAGWHPWSQRGLDEYDSIRRSVASILAAPMPPAVVVPPAPSSSAGKAALAIALTAAAAWAANRYL